MRPCPAPALPPRFRAQVETDKATMEWEATDEGTVARILAPAGSEAVPVGQVVAVLVEEAEDAGAFADYEAPAAGAEASAAPAATAAPAAAAAAAPRAPATPGRAWPAHEVLLMPSLSPTMQAGGISQWKVAAGDEVAAGDVLCEVETDKATMDWEATDDGVVAKILVPEGEAGVEVGVPVLVIVEEANLVGEFSDFTAADAGSSGAEAPAAAAPPDAPAPAAAAAAPAAPAATASAPAAALAGPAAGGARGGPASPYARRLAAEQGVDVRSVQGRGPGGRVVGADVLDHVSAGGAVTAVAAAPAAGALPSAAFTDIPNSQIRKVIASRLLESKQTVPHYYLSIDCEIDRLMKLRKDLNAATGATGGPKISVNDFVVKSAALACAAVPEVNAAWMGDFVRQYSDVDISVAVQTDSGLMVPIVFGAHDKSIGEISSEIKALAAKAKEGKLKPHEFQGGTFTISNLGMFGVKQFAAIVNPPQACILAVGGAQKVPKLVGGELQEASTVTVTLSCDHRVVDGAVGARWLQAFKGFMEEPVTIML